MFRRPSLSGQVPTPEGYFGNAVRMLDVSLPANTSQPTAGDAVGAVAALAGAIRLATAAFRAQPVRQMRMRPGVPANVPFHARRPRNTALTMRPHMCAKMESRNVFASIHNPQHWNLPARVIQEMALEAMAATEALVGVPLLRMLSHMLGVLQPNITSLVNYNPKVRPVCLPTRACLHGGGGMQQPAIAQPSSCHCRRRELCALQRAHRTDSLRIRIRQPPSPARYQPRRCRA